MYELNVQRERSLPPVTYGYAKARLLPRLLEVLGHRGRDGRRAPIGRVDAREALAQVDALVDDFLTRAFGPAKEPMGAFYRLIDGAERPLLCDDLLGRMYRSLGQAKALADSPGIRARVDALVLYTRYVELFRIYSGARGPARQAGPPSARGRKQRAAQTRVELPAFGFPAPFGAGVRCTPGLPCLRHPTRTGPLAQGGQVIRFVASSTAWTSRETE